MSEFFSIVKFLLWQNTIQQTITMGDLMQFKYLSEAMVLENKQ